MTALYSLAEIRAIERAATRMLAPGTLMQRAGQAAAKLTLGLLPHATGERKVLVLAGPGNNGGDALEAAARIAHAGESVSILLFADPLNQSTDAQHALAHARQSRANFVDIAHADKLLAQSWSLIIDGLFGIGLTRPISGELRNVIERVNQQTCKVLALDIPSGLDADSGNVVGQPGIAVHATHTISFIADKPGLHTADGQDYAGKVTIDTLSIDPLLFTKPLAQLNDVSLFSKGLKRRLHNSHKGSYGDVVVVGGANGMAGACVLAARAASYCGAGRTFAAFIDQPPAYDSNHPELMFRNAQELDFAGKTLAAGPGLGQSEEAKNLLAKVLDARASLVLDADALNMIAHDASLRQQLIARADATILTPHPLEAARLLGTTVATIQADRLLAARTLARDLNAIVILKGSGSVIAQAHGNVAINPTGNAALATAGSG
ncbi:MAG TPA: NAD(P)H-hydrate dehydratase, partial [Burkholderiaceae bacterium]|nr:NAD(P)H-hydrate dehydratase [Burkholderiaceae bacterium]